MTDGPRALNPFCFAIPAWRNRALVARLSKRRVEARFRGSVFGMGWAIVNPLLMLAVYTFVFSVVFRSRWGVDVQGDSDFALFLFSGLILYALFSESANAAPLSLQTHRSMIQQVRFPSEVISWTCMLAALFNLAIAFSVFCVAHFVLRGAPLWTWLLLPAILLPMTLLALGSGWVLSAVGALVEDVAQLVGVFTTALLFLSPIFYSSSRIPEAFHSYYFLNPFAHLIEMSKGVLFFGEPPNWSILIRITVMAWLFAWASFLWFWRSKETIADVL